jgi:hypothetical protein
MKRVFPNKLLILALWAVLLAISSLEIQASTIKVPSDRQTIQAAISAAVEEDTILVSPGTYNERIDFLGKGITVQSEAGPQVTFINGTGLGSVVTFNAAEPSTARLIGFTIQNGLGLDGGGIFIRFASPQIINNIVKNNTASSGGGVHIIGGTPLLQSNIISNNQAGSGGGPGGGGIQISGGSSARIINNLISENVISNSVGGGIAISGAGELIIQGNIIRKNRALRQGGGVYINDDAPTIISQNLIIENEAGVGPGGISDGGGIYWLMPNSPNRYKIINNTIVNNDAERGSGVFADGYDAQTEFTNNIVVGKRGSNAFHCGEFNDLNLPIIRFNNVYSPRGSTYGGICPDQTGTNGNISSNPLFRDLSGDDYHLGSGSPCLDAGVNDVLGLPNADPDGNPRIVDGNGDGANVIDIGAYEKQGPGIQDVSIEGKNIIIRGTNFDSDSVILMNGVEQKTRYDNQNPTTILIGKKLRNKIGIGQTVKLQVRDSDGALSPEFNFTRSEVVVSRM